MTEVEWEDSPTGEAAQLPLAGLRVLDLTTLLPGPLATLMLSEAGADVLKVERPGTGDDMRDIPPFTAEKAAIRFLMLNARKRSIALDLKGGGRERLVQLARSADVLVEQFRPGVMDRLGLGYAELASENPSLIYCSITGYGQDGPRASAAAHDLNYQADSGLLSMVTGDDGTPSMPPATWADIAGGSYPAVMNILLALLRRDRTGTGTHLDVAMTENMLTFIYWGVASGFDGHWPRPNRELLIGGSPRYALYQTSDSRWLAVAAIEQRFWEAFCGLISLEERYRDDSQDPEATRRAVVAAIRQRTAAYWEATLSEQDACTNLVLDLQEAVSAEHVRARGIYARRVAMQGSDLDVPAMHLPLATELRRPAGSIGRAPSLPDP